MKKLYLFESEGTLPSPMTVMNKINSTNEKSILELQDYMIICKYRFINGYQHYYFDVYKREWYPLDFIDTSNPDDKFKGENNLDQATNTKLTMAYRVLEYVLTHSIDDKEWERYDSWMKLFLQDITFNQNNNN